MKAIIAAAGTGGHINPGIAIANKIKEKEPTSEIIFIGTKRGLENDLVPRAGYKLKTIDAYGISRKITFSNISKLFKTYKSIGVSKKIIEKFKPDIVIGTGGYICGPVITAAHKCKIPTILHESNAFPGVAVKMLASKVDTILIAFEDAKKRIKKAKNIVLTGTPTKVKKLELDNQIKSKIKQELGCKGELPLVLVFGGSQGAKSINEAIIKIIQKKSNEDYHIVWATGTSQFDSIKEQLENINISISNIKNTKILPYIYNMEEVLNVTDLVISRSGAMTVTELSKVGVPAVFIPYPFATENHQEYNAKVLTQANGAKIILDKDLNEENLSKTINQIIKDKNKLDEMRRNCLKVNVENVEEKIYDEIKKLTK